jgi:hypothetical protein
MSRDTCAEALLIFIFDYVEGITGIPVFNERGQEVLNILIKFEFSITQLCNTCWK